MRRRLLVIVLCIPIVLLSEKRPRQAEVTVQKTSLTRDREIQLGREAAAQVEREVDVVKAPEVEQWLNQIGQRLAKTRPANAYPYYFKLVNEDSINAVALPGGPIYIYTGLLKAADNEADVAGVLAHEMSHVALRHGASQFSNQTWGTLEGVLGSTVGGAGRSSGECGMLCQVGELGAGIGGSSVLMKFSREFERDADLNGARMMAAAGYDPIQLPKFLEKLEAAFGTAAEPKGLPTWVSDHPATGSRVQYVSQDIQSYPKHAYTADTGRFPRIKQVVASLPPPVPKPGALILAKQGANARTDLPPDFMDYQANGFAIAYPSAWQAGQPQPGASLYLIPTQGATRTPSGIELILGAMVDYYVPQAGPTDVNLADGTREFIDSLRKGDSSLRAEAPQRAEVGGRAALLTKLKTRTSLQQEPDQVISLYTVARQGGLWYVALAAQPSKMGELEQLFQQIIDSVQFPN